MTYNVALSRDVSEVTVAHTGDGSLTERVLLHLQGL